MDQHRNSFQLLRSARPATPQSILPPTQRATAECVELVPSPVHSAEEELPWPPIVVLRRPQNDGALVGLQIGQSLMVQGRVLVAVLRGSVSVLGYRLSASRISWVPVYSPVSHSLLTVDAVADEAAFPGPPHSSGSPYVQLGTDWPVEWPDTHVVLALMDLSWDGLDGLAEVYAAYRIFSLPSDAPANPQSAEDIEIQAATVLRLPSCRLLIPSPLLASYVCIPLPMLEWMGNVRARSTLPPRILLYGEKGTGKSTLTRYLMHTLLNKYPAVAHLECDVSQSEFSPAGLVSVTLVTEPLCGPPMTHPRQPCYAAVFADNNPGHQPAYYFGCVMQAFQYYQQKLSSVPLVINTMGWITGLGHMLQIQIMQFCRPDSILFLQRSPRDKVDLEMLRSSHHRYFWPKGHRKPSDHSLSRWNPQLVYIPAYERPLAEVKLAISASRILARDIVNLMLLSYFGARDLDFSSLDGIPVLVSTRRWDFKPLTSRIPYFVPISSVQSRMLNCRLDHSLYLSLMNASIVFLMASKTSTDVSHGKEPFRWVQTDYPDENLVFKCIGIVRSVVPPAQDDSGAYYIIAPFQKVELTETQVLIRCALEIPQCILYQDERITCGPYGSNLVVDGSLGHLHRKVRRNILRHENSGLNATRN